MNSYAGGDMLRVKNLEATDKTIGAYMEHLCETYVFYKVRRHDIKGKN